MAGLDSIKHLRGDDLIAAYKERYGDKTLLAFSRGKDSIAVSLALRDKIEVIPCHYDDLLGLEFVEESLAYDVLRMVKDQEGMTGEILSAAGLRALDNAVRFISIRKHGPIRPVAGNWPPIWDWSKQKLLDTIEQSGISRCRPTTRFCHARSTASRICFCRSRSITRATISACWSGSRSYLQKFSDLRSTNDYRMPRKPNPNRAGDP
jgi:hypothetical protein